MMYRHDVRLTRVFRSLTQIHKNVSCGKGRFFIFFWMVSIFFYPGQVHSFNNAELFGSQQVQQNNLDNLTQWLSVLERHITEDVPEGACSDSIFNRCHLKRWVAFLGSIRDLPPQKQIDAVNDYANKKRYVLDLDNYGKEDYWAVVREFFYNGGDCEDYAITKFFSLRWLAIPVNDMRVVILQDTNLRISHAILAVWTNDDVLILDNQSQEVLSHRRIAHYIPLYSVNERHWWLHLPHS